VRGLIAIAAVGAVLYLKVAVHGDLSTTDADVDVDVTERVASRC
jgi:hypothetical protein